MSDPAFIFQQWENRIPYYVLQNMEEEQICILEATWAKSRSKGIRFAMATTFGGGWRSVLKEAGKQSLKYGGRKALGAVTTIVCGYFGSVGIVLLTKSTRVVKYAKICHSVCSGGLDIAELCASTPILAIEILVFGRPALLKAGQGFDAFEMGEIDPIDKFFDK